MAKQIKFYYDLLSQPSRALYIFFEINQIPHIPIQISLLKREHLTESFKNVNRFQKLPCIDDNQFKLSESVAIFRYLIREKLIPTHWYPRNSIESVKIDEYLSWQHNNIRFGSTMLVKSKYILPTVTGQKPDEILINEYENVLEKSLDAMENIWLKHNNDYLIGKQISIADLLAACEIEHTQIVGYNSCAGRPRLTEWLENVKKTTNPYYNKAHEIVEKLASEHENKDNQSVASV